MTFDDEFDELVSLAYQMAFQVLGSRSDAEEIAQDTMAKAYVRWRRVQNHARPWVCRVAINGALGRVRRRRGRDHGTRLEPGRVDSDEVNERLDLQRLLRSLSRRQRDVIALRYLADMSEADLAAELGISIGSVKTHAHRGIATLRGSLDASNPSTSTSTSDSTDSNQPAREPTETTDVRTTP